MLVRLNKWDRLALTPSKKTTSLGTWRNSILKSTFRGRVIHSNQLNRKRETWCILEVNNIKNRTMQSSIGSMKNWLTRRRPIAKLEIMLEDKIWIGFLRPQESPRLPWERPSRARANSYLECPPRSTCGMPSLSKTSWGWKEERCSSHCTPMTPWN